MHPPGALAGAAGLVDHLAAAVTGGTGALDGEEALLGAHAAATVAGLAADRLGTALGAAAAAGLAGRRADRKRVVEGKSGAVRVELGGRRRIKKKKKIED